MKNIFILILYSTIFFCKGNIKYKIHYRLYFKKFIVQVTSKDTGMNLYDKINPKKSLKKNLKYREYQNSRLILHIIYNHVISQTNISPFFLLFHPLYLHLNTYRKWTHSNTRFTAAKFDCYSHTPVHIPSSTCTSFRFSPLNSFFVMHFSFTQARLRSGVRYVRARSPLCLCRCGNTGQPYTRTYTPRISLISAFALAVARAFVCQQ